jgi:hypothetical protein
VNWTNRQHTANGGKDALMAKWIETMKQIAESLGILKSTMSRINSQRETAKAALAQARDALKQHLLSPDGGDKATIAVLKTQIVSERELITALDDAAETQNALVGAEECRLADDETKRRRTAAADVMIADAMEIKSVAKTTVASMRQTASKLARYAGQADLSALSEFFDNGAVQAEVALAVSLSGLMDSAQAVLEGRERIPSAPAPIVKLVPPKPLPTETIYFLKPSKWTDASGELHLIQRTTDAILPVALAKHAIKIGAAVDRNDPQRKQTLGGWAGRPLRGADCIALDVASETSNVMSSHFETVDRGPPITGTMRQPGAMTPAPMAATRTEKSRP